ncbi:Rrf2 family transcriptional regulator [Bosea sp. TWI1241]|uniref:RrF2 family transcriptional regulator n=1 Tax=Bosea sp. TWI1241 TaxID=3148904 RepID=UPI00320AE3BF
MIQLSRRSALAIAAVVDIALHARGAPVAAKALAARLDLPPRHLETMLQALVRAGILKGLRGPRGGYELARERRRITAGGILRATMLDPSGELPAPSESSPLLATVITPLVQTAMEACLATLDTVTVAELCEQAENGGLTEDGTKTHDFTI